MKRKLKVAVLLALLLLLVGCFKEDVKTSRRYSTSKTNDEMLEIYQEYLPEVEKLFTEKGVELEYGDSRYSIYDTQTYVRSPEIAGDSATDYFYELTFLYDDTVSGISIRMTTDVDEEDLRTNGFKIEESELYKIHDIFIPYMDNAEEINRKLKSIYDGDTVDKTFHIKTGTHSEMIILRDNRLSYTIYLDN